VRYWFLWGSTSRITGLHPGVTTVRGCTPPAGWGPDRPWGACTAPQQAGGRSSARREQRQPFSTLLRWGARRWPHLEAKGLVSELGGQGAVW